MCIIKEEYFVLCNFEFDSLRTNEYLRDKLKTKFAVMLLFHATHVKENSYIDFLHIKQIS
jgi:hypothetical protein